MGFVMEQFSDRLRRHRKEREGERRGNGGEDRKLRREGNMELASKFGDGTRRVAALVED